MPITPISSSNTAGATATPQSTLNMQEFLQLLTTQLSSQDPLNPMNDTEFFAQMAQLGTVQGIDTLKQSMDVMQASSLIGKTVTAVRPGTENGTGISDNVTGVVKKLNITNGQYLLQLESADGSISQVKMANVQSVGD